MIDKYKEFKSNRRLVGTIKLVFWLIPITIIIIMSHSHSPKTGTPTPVTPEKKDYLTNLSEMTYYKFDYELDDIKYEGKFADSIITLYNEKANYLIKYDKVYYEKKDKPNDVANFLIQQEYKLYQSSSFISIRYFLLLLTLFLI